MTAAASMIDSLIREYLVFRGFSSTLKQFDADMKIEKEKGFKVDRIVEHLCALISSNDLRNLRDLWEHLNSKVFLNLDHVQAKHADRLEEDLYKLYLANCVQNRRYEKATEFFEIMGQRLYEVDSWKEWFDAKRVPKALPYLPNPQEQATFRPYFAKQWQETFLISLHNFLSLAFYQMDVPTLLSYIVEQKSQKSTAPTAETTKTQVSKMLLQMQAPPPDLVASAEVMDDFYVIAQASPASDSAGKSLKSVIKKKFASKRD